MNCLFCDYVKRKSDVGGFVAELSSSIVIISFNQQYWGRCLVIHKRHETSLLNLSGRDSKKFYEDMLKVANAIEKAFDPDKMNYALLGNEVEHIHWHVIPRYKNDGNWGGPPWPSTWPREKRLQAEEYNKMVTEIKKRLK